MTQILDGKLVAERIYHSLKNYEELQPTGGSLVRAIGSKLFSKDKVLAIITIGEDEASKVYVGRKKKKVEEMGCSFMHICLNRGVAFSVLEETIMYLNAMNHVKGIIVQKPLPNGLKAYEKQIDNLIVSHKDVDGFSANSEYTPCTPLGIISLLKEYEVSFTKKNVVIAGRSSTVSKPLADILTSQYDCTVTMIHTQTDEDTIEQLINNCDIFVSAIGKPHYWKEHHFRDNKHKIALIDVGISRDENGKLKGDVHPDAYKHFDFYTPVPGGVGQMTVAGLITNFANACIIE